MKKASVITGMVASLIALGGTAVSAQQSNPAGTIPVKNEEEARFAGMAKVSMDSAINAALKEVQGKVLRTELENQNGYLVYGIEIAKTDHEIVDVNVDGDLDKVFDRFYRADKSRSKEGGGIGLGLSICEEIVKLHGGRIEIKSQIGTGTTVSIYLKENRHSPVSLYRS
jgi:sensor histidine kinase regulating citrate/malate metabolism